ncbi:hypothetical protein I6G66_00950 [Delftia acidovorans]|uniref:Uncharacterized protein n=1 Tax=Delftia acidovorans TaxID=80866 RepID=A0A7T2S4E8_DELAC|nr:hypothetical protein [Delftia acidovorans]QPS08672.1 hypothetical protein I6G66_00950 [Delftia acidovorans]
MPLAQVQSLWSKDQQARDKALGNPFVQQALHEARNDDKVWNTPRSCRCSANCNRA